ncbi:MAG: hypothetical protein ABI888_05660 [Chloroflexota bacterium]
MDVLREGLRGEFPTAFDLAARARRPAVTAMMPALVAVGALGVASLTVALVRTIQSAGVYATGTYLVRSSESVTIVGYAAATVFAFGSARWRGVAASVTLFAVMWIQQFWLGASGRQIFCERSGISCDFLTFAWPGIWPQLVGIAFGLAAVRLVRHGAPGIAALALGAGVTAISSALGRLAFVPFLGTAPLGDDSRAAVNTIIIVALIGALAAGLVLGAFGRRHVLDALIVIAYFVGPWSPQLATLRDSPRPFILGIDWQLFVPVGYAIAAVVGLAIGVALARLRHPEASTVRD